MRGEIVYKARARQLNDFSGLVFGKITPTDIDGLIEYQDKAYVIIEVKHGDAPMPRGQALCYERMIDDYYRVGKQAIALVVEHEIHDESKIVPVEKCRVRELYWGGENRWRPPNRAMTARELLDSFFEYVNSKPRI